MSVIVKNILGEVFDLPSDYVIEATRTHPLFSNKGPQTAPVNFPATDKNRRLTGFANRMDASRRPPETVRAVIDAGSVSQTGLLSIGTASEKTISANIGWDESEMYADMNKTLLSDLSGLPVFSPLESPLNPPQGEGVDGESAGVDARVEAMLLHLHGVMDETVTADYMVFPVILKESVDPSSQGGGQEMYYFDMLNNTFMNTVEEFGDSRAANGAIGGFKAKTNRTIDRVVENEVIEFDVPKGYAVSPFLRAWKALDLIFVHYGYRLENNPLYEDVQLRRLVVLNNVMDTIVTGRLSYKDMMPDITVEEFLEALRNKFGLLWFVDSNSRSVRFAYLRDILRHLSPGSSPSSPPAPLQNGEGGNTGLEAVDLSGYKAGEAEITYGESRQLKLKINHEIKTVGSSHETYEEFLASFDYQFLDVYDVYRQTTVDQKYSLIYTALLRYYATCDQYLKSGNVIAPVSEDLFDYDKKDDLPYETIEMKDLSLPYMNYAYPVDNQGMEMMLVALMYLVGYKHNYTNVSITGKAVGAVESPAKLAFAFGWGKIGISNLPVDGYDFAYGSQDNRGWDGSPLNPPQGGLGYELSLTVHREDGLFNRFWKEYDAFLRHSGHSVEIKLNIPVTSLMRLKMYQRVIIDSQPYLIEEIKYKMGGRDSVASLKLRTLRLYEPYDLSVEQQIPVYTAQQYYWKMTSVKTPDYSDMAYTIVSGYGPAGDSNRLQLLWNPPTEREFWTAQRHVYVYNYRIFVTLLGQYFDVREVVTFVALPID
jgi:hypothetical protein